MVADNGTRTRVSASMGVSMSTTGSGIVFAILPPQAGGPAPTLLSFAMGGADTLTIEPYARIARLVHARGWNVASLDLPCHGGDRVDGEPAELAGWASRLGRGDDIVVEFRRRVGDVLAWLIERGIADPGRIAASGTSRGGFLAFHAAMGDPRIRAVAAFSPVTDLLALREFADHGRNRLVVDLALVARSSALAGRASWITIGGDDERVDTDRCIAFARAVSRADRRREPGVGMTLRVMPTPGHQSFGGWHDDAALWLDEEFGVHASSPASIGAASGASPSSA